MGVFLLFGDRGAEGFLLSLGWKCWGGQPGWRERILSTTVILQEVSWSLALLLIEPNSGFVLWESLLSFLYQKGVCCCVVWSHELVEAKWKCSRMNTSILGSKLLLFFLSGDFVLKMWEKCIWKWRGECTYFLIIKLLLFIFLNCGAFPPPKGDA